MHPVLKVAGEVHIWYYIPLCSILAQKFNSDFFGTKSRSKNPIPISKEDSLTHQSGNPWRQSEDHSTIQITWPSRSWGWYLHSGFFPRFILRGITPFQSVVKASSISILLGQLNWSIQVTIQSTCMSWPNWAN
ncbi:hypothetical protein O181_121138 [Austropuccinia psidii MF-1]|uniref:Uncharacterized protein n=1 Tax=Austropuccinia psidii MF-1 TaxID=1389203 RepID=A0A9Q3KHC6_9BASI|nr:hypothetical protein [Austropuccinia psidii MF-1]